MDKFLTVIVQTSPLPSHPSTALLEALFRSFDRVKGLKECNIIVLCDGCEQEPLPIPKGCKPNYKHGAVSQEGANEYQQHLQLLQGKIENLEPPFVSSRNGTIQLLKLSCRHGSARAIAAAFETMSISTPYVMIAQHDNFFVRDVNYVKDIIDYMERGESKSWLQCVHFPSTATLNYVQKVKRRYGLDLEQYCRQAENVPVCGEFIPLVFWYGRTHIARTHYYSDKILCEYPLKVGDHLEEVWGTKQLREMLNIKSSSLCNKDGDNLLETQFREIHEQFGNYVFFEEDGDEEVLYHLSGRKAHATNDRAHSAGKAELCVSDEIFLSKSTFNPRGKSFTNARRAVAFVPGLEFRRESAAEATAAPKSKFRQRCFHCGEKGHSFKFCPEILNGNGKMPSVEILDL